MVRTTVPGAVARPTCTKEDCACQAQRAGRELFNREAEPDGVSFLSTLQGKTEPELNRDLYFCWLEGGPQHGGKTTDAFRRGDWKLVQDDPFGPRELFNLRTDPGETT